jgi:hypothetical protein
LEAMIAGWRVGREVVLKVCMYRTLERGDGVVWW